jgi:phage shock protein PspC (stress-responsive transcriptional regulator)
MLCANCQKDIPAGSNFCCNCGTKQPDASQPAYAAPPYSAYAAPRRRIVRSINDRKLAGVCAGVADYFDLDPMLVRILWLLLVFCAGTGVLAYFVCWILFPEGYTGVAQNAQTTQGVPYR